MEQDGRGVSGNEAGDPNHEDCREEAAGMGLSDGCIFAASGDLVVRDMPEIKVLEHLKNDAGTLDIGKTIKDLFESMQNMDAQLSSVLSINAALEKNLKASKEVIARLKSEKSQMDETITALRGEMPSKRELQEEIWNLTEERNEVQASIRSMKIVVEKTKGEMNDLNRKVVELENEKSDLGRDINYLEIKLGAALEKLNAYAKEITILKGEKRVNLEKIDDLRAQNKKCMEEKGNPLKRNLNI